MKPERAVMVERLLFVLGFLAIVVAIGAVDWRAGLLVAGLGAIGSTIDLRRAS